MTSFLKDGRSRAAAVWLFGVAVIVFAMVVLGGATRLTGSGLSITEWKPVSGALPPLSEADWQRYFALYQATPQYRQVNAGMSLADFQFIFWWEWAHRFLGRLAGVAFAVPFAVLLLMKRLPPRLIWRSVVLLFLGGLQGLVGWWMVQSGLEHRVSVAPERLALHLGLALVLLASLVWVGLEAWFGAARGRTERRDGWTIASAVFLGLIFLQCLLGALVAGNQAGLVDNDWPLMGREVFPSDYAGHGLWATLAHSRPAVQFNHRILAYILVASGLALAFRAMRPRFVTAPIRGLAFLVGGAVVAQAALGVATLMTGVPLALAIVHQAMAALLLILAVVLAWRARRG